MHALTRVFSSAPANRPVRARTLLALGLAATLGLLPAATHAAPITGDLSISGSLTLGSSTIDFQPNGTGSGSFVVLAPETGSFVSLPAGSTGTILDLDASTAPVGSAFSKPSFLTHSAAPNLALTLTFIAPGIFSSSSCFAPPAPGQTCTPLAAAPSYLPAFDLVNTGLGSTLSFAVSGTITNLTDMSVSDVSGVFTAQFARIPYQTVLATLGAGGTVAAAYSASFSAVVPEPATALLVALGAAGLALLRRREAP